MTIATFNYIESILWFILAAAIVYKYTTQQISCQLKSASVIAVIGFIVFGFTDIIEAQTGAWWRPWWLLVLKGICVVTLIFCYLKYKQVSKSGDD